MKFDNLEQRVIAAKSNPDEMNDLIKEYIPFIRKAAVKTISPEVYDSYSTTAMSAFAEAVGKFRKNEGRFLGFASLVIANRIKDQIRKEYKPDEIPSDVIEKSESYEETHDRSIEVDMFKNELSEYGINMDDLLEISPRHRKTRIKADLAAEALSENTVLFSILERTKKVPIKRLSGYSGISLKLIEQKRKYIIARALLRHEKYLYLREFVK